MRLMMITLLAGAGLATGAAVPNEGVLSGNLQSPSVIQGGSCNDGPSVNAREWALAREGKGPGGANESVRRPPVRAAIAMEADVSALGNREGSRFSHTGCGNGNAITKLEVWGERRMEGIRMTFRDGEQFAAGSPLGCYESHDFEPGERITYLEQSTDCRGNRHGKIRFNTSATKYFEAAWDDGEGEFPVLHSFDVHSGFLCGMSGFQEGGVNALALLFAPKASSVSLEIDPASVPHGVITFTDEAKVLHFVNNGAVQKYRHSYLENRAFAYEAAPGVGLSDATVVNALVEVLDGSVAPRGDDAAAGEDEAFTIQRMSVAGGVHYGAFELPHMKFLGTRKFEVDLAKKAFKFEIPPESECDFVVIKHIAHADQAPWSGTETFFLDDGSSYSLPVSGNLTGFDVVNQSIKRVCFALGSYSPYYANQLASGEDPTQAASAAA